MEEQDKRELLTEEQKIEENNDIEDAEFNELFVEHEGDIEDTIFEFCFRHNFPYCEDTAKSLAGSAKYVESNNRSQIYMDMVNATKKYEGVTFFSQLKRVGFEKIYNEKLSLQGLSEEDRKNRMAVLDILSYDPFREDDPQDKPQLYRDLAGMLTEGMRKDVAKAKAALAIVRSYNNLEKNQKQINDILKSGELDENAQKRLDQLMKISKTIQDSINGTAEKNNFTVKGLGNNGRGMLSDVINQIEEKGIDLGITNFYDIETSKAIEQIAGISWKAMMNQVNLSKTDYAEILSDQLVIVKEAQEKAKDAMEALRLAKEKITKQELLQELEKDFRQKGISEEDINEFIEREIEMYELSN